VILSLLENSGPVQACNGIALSLEKLKIETHGGKETLERNENATLRLLVSYNNYNISETPVTFTLGT